LNRTRVSIVPVAHQEYLLACAEAAGPDEYSCNQEVVTGRNQRSIREYSILLGAGLNSPAGVRVGSRQVRLAIGPEWEANRSLNQVDLGGPNPYMPEVLEMQGSVHSVR